MDQKSLQKGALVGLRHRKRMKNHKVPSWTPKPRRTTSFLTIFEIVQPILAPPRNPKNRPGGGHDLNFGVQEGSQEGILSEFGENPTSKHFFEDFRLKNVSKNKGELSTNL